MTIKNVIGKQFGNLTVTQQLESNGYTQWLCKCVCGREVVRTGGSLARAKSCGCTVGRPRNSAKNEKETYQVWTYIRNKYKGQICERWNDASLFIYDMGTKPNDSYLARKNQNEIFSKENCKWEKRKNNIKERVRSNKTGYSGVQHVKKTGKFSASLHVYLGTYEDAVSAARAYDEVARMLKEILDKKIAINFSE